MVLSDISIRRPVFATVINLVVLLVGIIAYDRLAVRLIPNVDVPVVTVNTVYPGANARVIESQITQPIEDALSGVEGIDFIQSVSREQSSQVTVRFRLDRDADSAASDVRDRVSQARQFLPEEADEPIVQKQEADANPIIWLAFSSDRHETVEIADIAERLVKDRVQTIPGVAQAQVYGNRYAMRIWLEPARLVKRLFGRYMRSRDLVTMGAYSAGSDPELDTALRVWPGIASYLQQAPDDLVDRQAALAGLAALGLDIQQGR